MSWGRCGRSAGVIVWLLVVARLAHADEAIELRVAPDARGCITEAALRERIESLHVQAKDAAGLALAVDASIDRPLLEVRRDDVVIATRRFDVLPERCAQRLQTIALVLALAIEHATTPDDDAAVEPLEPAPPAAETEPQAAPLTPSARKNEPAPQAVSGAYDREQTEQREPGVRAIVGVGAAYGLLPELAGTLALAVELPSTALRIGLGALVTTEASTDLAGGTALTRLAAARVYGCAADEGLGLDLHACAGMALGVMYGSGRRYAHSADATGTVLAPLLRLGARYPARGTFSVGLAFDGLVHLVRPELQVAGNAGAASALPLFGGAVSLEGVLALP